MAHHSMPYIIAKRIATLASIFLSSREFNVEQRLYAADCCLHREDDRRRKPEEFRFGIPSSAGETISFSLN